MTDTHQSEHERILADIERTRQSIVVDMLDYLTGVATDMAIPAERRRIAKALIIDNFAERGISATIDEYDCLIIDIDPIHIWITARPSYCDRGKWQVNAESKDPRRLTIDAADGFPRYYFSDDAMVLEVTLFMAKRLMDLDVRGA